MLDGCRVAPPNLAASFLPTKDTDVITFVGGVVARSNLELPIEPSKHKLMLSHISLGFMERMLQIPPGPANNLEQEIGIAKRGMLARDYKRHGAFVGKAIAEEAIVVCEDAEAGSMTTTVSFPNSSRASLSLHEYMSQLTVLADADPNSYYRQSDDQNDFEKALFDELNQAGALDDRTALVQQ